MGFQGMCTVNPCLSPCVAGYEVMLTFCPTDTDGNGSNSSVVSVCQTRRHRLDPSTLFFVLNNEVLPDYEHNLTFTVSDTLLYVDSILYSYM